VSTAAIFFVGLFVTAITFVATFLVGIQEAGDPSQSRPEDLTNFEKHMVDRPDID
jgi:hypothetical protein